MNTSSFNSSIDPLAALIQFYHITGNTNIQAAEVVALTYNPALQDRNEHSTQLINQIWDQHLILVENAVYKTSIKASDHPVTRYVKHSVSVQGWDNLFTQSRIKELVIKEKKIAELENYSKTELDKKSLWCAKEREDTVDEIKKFINNIITDSEKLSKIDDVLEALLTKSLSIKILHECMDGILEYLKNDLCELTQIYYYSLFSMRQVSIQMSIENGLRSSKKVIVCLNGNHLIHNPRLSDQVKSEVDFLLNFLKDKKFVILHPRKSHLTLLNQVELWKVKSKGEIEKSFNETTCFSPKPRRTFSINFEEYNDLLSNSPVKNNIEEDSFDEMY